MMKQFPCQRDAAIVHDESRRKDAVQCPGLPVPSAEMRSVINVSSQHTNKGALGHSSNWGPP